MGTESGIDYSSTWSWLSSTVFCLVLAQMITWVSYQGTNITLYKKVQTSQRLHLLVLELSDGENTGCQTVILVLSPPAPLRHRNLKCLPRTKMEFSMMMCWNNSTWQAQCSSSLETSTGIWHVAFILKNKMKKLFIKSIWYLFSLLIAHFATCVDTRDKNRFMYFKETLKFCHSCRWTYCISAFI